MSLLLTAAVAASWIAIAALLFGIGACFLRMLAPVALTWGNALLAVLAGVSLLFGGLMLWHLLRPVDHVALAVFVIAGMVGMVKQRDWLSALSHLRPTWLYVAPLCAFLLWTANHALGDAGWDDYNYELQTVRWFHDHAIVPGLANLHGRFGFNNSHHLFAALLAASPWKAAGNHLVNGFFVVLAFAYSWTACVELLEKRMSGHAMFAALMLGPVVMAALQGSDFGLAMISTLKADVLVAALTLLVACLWVEFGDRGTAADRRLLLAVTIGLAAALLFSIKLSSLVFVGVLLAGLFVTMARTPALRRLLPAVFIVVTVICGLVLARGIVLSGYPLYPSTIGGVNVDWRVPQAQADIDRGFITTWSRLQASFDIGAPQRPWLHRWSEFTALTNRATLLVPLVVALGLVPLAALRLRERTADGVGPAAWLVMGLACVAALTVWFVQAPDARFAWSYMWILAGIVVALAVGRAAPKSVFVWSSAVATAVAGGMLLHFDLTRTQGVALLATITFAWLWSSAVTLTGHPRLRLAGALCVLLALFPLADRLGAAVLYRRTPEVGSILWLRVGGLPKSEGRPATARQTHSGLTVYETQWSDYDTQLPGTPYFNRYLELRSPSDLSRGFRNTALLPYPLVGYRPRVGGSTPDP
jgi:hypothetical protein